MSPASFVARQSEQIMLAATLAVRLGASLFATLVVAGTTSLKAPVGLLDIR